MEREMEGEKEEYVFGDIFEVLGLNFKGSPTFIFPSYKSQ